MTIPIIIVDHHFWKASALFNPNAFPARAKADASMCGDRLAILTHSVQIVLNEPGLDRVRLLKEIRDNKSFAGFKPQPDKPVVIVLHNLNFVSGIYSTLVALKSLLDFYARLVARLLVPTADVFGFSSGTHRSRKITGGRFLNWIERSTPSSFANKDKFISIVIKHIDEWLDTAITYRDDVVHAGAIEGLREVMLPLDKEIQQVQESDIILPTMPNGTAVIEYCEQLAIYAHSFIRETLLLMPDVDLNFLSLKKDAPEPEGPSTRGSD